MTVVIFMIVLQRGVCKVDALMLISSVSKYFANCTQNVFQINHILS